MLVADAGLALLDADDLGRAALGAPAAADALLWVHHRLGGKRARSLTDQRPQKAGHVAGKIHRLGLRVPEVRDAGGQAVGVNQHQLLSKGGAQSPGDALLDGGDLAVLHGNQVAQKQVQTERVGAGDQAAGVPDGAAGRTVALHRFHRVHHGQHRRHRLRQVHQHRAEVVAVLVAVVQLRLLQAGDAPKQIFHTAREPGHAVGFQLAHRDDDVRLPHRVNQIKFRAHFRVTGGDVGAARFQIEQGAGLLSHLLHPAGAVDRAQLRGGVQPAGGVGDDDLLCPHLLQAEDDCPHHLRVGGGGLLGAAAHQQVGLDQDIFVPEQLRGNFQLGEDAPNRPLDGLLRVVVRLHHGDIGVGRCCQMGLHQ